jgi:hypothetical protein
MDIPTEALVEIFLNLPPDNVLKNCEINRRSNRICKSNEFWRRYLIKNYI